MDGSSSARSPIIANPTPYVRPSFYPERGRAAAGIAQSGDASAACYRYLQSHNAGCTYPHMGSIYQNAIPTPSTSPFRVPVSGMSNLRQFWPPTPPPDGFGRLGMNTSLYPMYPAIAPLAPPSDTGMHGLIPRLGSSPSHYPHFFDAHKESSFLSPGLTIASPLTPTSSLASSTPLSSLPPSFDKSQPFSPLSLAYKSMDLCKQQYCHENDDIQRIEMYSDSVCHHPVTDQRRPGSANIEANSKYEKAAESGIYHLHQESHPHSVKSRNDSKLLKNNAGTEKKQCSKSEEDCSAVSSDNNLKSPCFQENLLESKTCKVKKSKNSQCSDYIDIVNISDTPKSSEDLTKSPTTDACPEKLRHKNCCLFPTSASSVVTSTPLTTSTSVTYSHQQFSAPSQIYSSASDLQMKREVEENRHDCQFAKSTCGKTWNDRSYVELCYCHGENGRKSCHVAHTGACKVSKMPKTEPSQSSCCAQRLSNHQECLPFMFQPTIYESNNHSNQISDKCAHLSLPQNDTEQLSPTWNVLCSSPNHSQLDAISKSTSIPELSGSSKEYKLPYPSEFLPDIQPLNFSSKPQQHDSKAGMQNPSCGSNERATSAPSIDAHSSSTPEKKTSIATTSSTVVCTAANSNIPVGIAIAQQRHSMSSAWKLGKLTDPHFPAAHNGSDGFPSLPNTSACHKNDSILRDQPYLSVKSIPTLPSNHSGLLVSPAAKQWESDTVPRTVNPHTWLKHGRVIAPGMWIGQGGYAPTTPSAGLPIGPLDSAQVSVPPVGYQLVRDSLTGHILLIPAVNIELVDGAQLWPKLENSATLHRQSTPQLQRPRYYQVPSEEDKLEHEESVTVHNINSSVAESLHNEKKLLIAEASEETEDVESPAPAASVEISVAGHVFEHSSLPPEKHSSTPLRNCEHRPIITLAQAPVAVQTNAKRSQATSPLISVPITLHHSNKQKVNHESSTNVKQSQSSTYDIPNNFYEDNNHQKTFAVQVNIEKETNTHNIEDEGKSIHSSENKKTEKCLKEHRVLEETTNTNKTENLLNKQYLPLLPVESHSPTNFIDHRGLNLLVDSIELNYENLASENKDLTKNSKTGCNISFTANLQKSQISMEATCKTGEQDYPSFPSLNTSSTDSLGILCALAEQRFIEETKSNAQSPTLSSSGGLCDSPIKVDRNDFPKEQMCVNKTSMRSASSKLKQHNFPECNNMKTPSEIESKEVEMRRRLAELQEKYKQKQKELARLQPRKNKKKKISTQRCPGRRHSVRPYMYYRIRKEKLMSKSGLSSLLKSLSDDISVNTKRRNLSENKYMSSKELEKNKLQGLHRVSKVLKRPNESNVNLHDGPLPARRKAIDEKLSHIKGDQNSSGRRIKKILFSKRKLRKQEIQQENHHQVGDNVVSFCESPQTTSKNVLQLTVSTSTMLTYENALPSSSSVKQKGLLSNNFVFQKDASKPNLCSEYCEKHKDKSETQRNQCNMNRNNENSAAGYEGDTSDVEVPPAKKRKLGKPKKHSSPKAKELSDDAPLKPTENFLSTKTNEIFPERNTMESEVKDLKLLHCSMKQPEISKSKKKMKLKKSIESSPKKVKNREHRKREKEEDISVTDELFAALKKCRLSETNMAAPSTTGDEKEQHESSYSEGENIPLSALIEKSPADVKSCVLLLENLHDKTRVLIMEEGLYYAGSITAIQAPDVYGIILDGERGNKPRIYSREEILSACILEVKPTHLRELSEGRRVCAFWSQQYRCLYPGAIGKVSHQANQDKSLVFVEFDDGDSGSIPIDDIRFLPQTVVENGKTDEEKKGEKLIIPNLQLEGITDAPLTTTVISQKKKHSVKVNASKKSKKRGNEGKHCLSKKEGKRKKCSENVLPKLKKHKKHKEDRKRNHRRNHHHHRHHHHHHHHHHHKKHKHEKSKGQSIKQSKPLLPSDSNVVKDVSEMSSTLPENNSYLPLSEVEKETAATALLDFNKLSRKKERNSSDDITQFLSTIKVTSDSLIEIKDDNTTEPQSERQLWSWYGKSFRRPGSKRKARKEYYRAIIRGNEILKVGDCAVFVSSGRPHLPYIGQIETMWQSWGGSMVVKVKWFYHPEEMKQNVDLSSFKGALFQSTHVDENDVQTISHKCELLTKQEYRRRMDFRRNTQSKGDNEDIYYLAGSYDPVSGTIMPELEYA